MPVSAVDYGHAELSSEINKGQKAQKSDRNSFQC